MSERKLGPPRTRTCARASKNAVVHPVSDGVDSCGALQSTNFAGNLLPPGSDLEFVNEHGELQNHGQAVCPCGTFLIIYQGQKRLVHGQPMHAQHAQDPNAPEAQTIGAWPPNSQMLTICGANPDRRITKLGVDVGKISGNCQRYTIDVQLETNGGSLKTDRDFCLFYDVLGQNVTLNDFKPLPVHPASPLLVDSNRVWQYQWQIDQRNNQIILGVPESLLWGGSTSADLNEIAFSKAVAYDSQLTYPVRKSVRVTMKDFWKLRCDYPSDQLLLVESPTEYSHLFADAGMDSGGIELIIYPSLVYPALSPLLNGPPAATPQIIRGSELRNLIDGRDFSENHYVVIKDPVPKLFWIEMSDPLFRVKTFSGANYNPVVSSFCGSVASGSYNFNWTVGKNMGHQITYKLGAKAEGFNTDIQITGLEVDTETTGTGYSQSFSGPAADPDLAQIVKLLLLMQAYEYTAYLYSDTSTSPIEKFTFTDAKVTDQIMVAYGYDHRYCHHVGQCAQSVDKASCPPNP